MALNFGDWISARGNKIGTGNKTVVVELPGIGKVSVCGNDQLDGVIQVENIRVAPLGETAELEQWCSNPELRQQVVGKLLEYFVQHSKTTQATKVDAIKVKQRLRVSQLKNILAQGSTSKGAQCGTRSECFAQRLVVVSTHCSMVAIANQLAPHLLQGVPLCLTTNAESAIQGAFLADLLAELGLPAGVLHHSVAFNVTQQGQTLTFVLLEDADVDAALDSALDAFIQFGWSSIKIFAQETLKSQIRCVFEQKLSTEYSTNDLILEDELFPTSAPELKIDFDAVDFETTRCAIDCFYFRSIGEVLKMVNFLKGDLATQLVSIWSENAALAIRVARQVQCCPSKLINCHVDDALANVAARSGWQIALATTSDKIGAALNASWRSLTVDQRFSSVSSALSLVDIAEKNTVKALLRKGATSVDDSVDADSRLRLIEYSPIGVINVAATEDSALLVSFVLNALILGNTVQLPAGVSQSLVNISAQLSSMGHDNLISFAAAPAAAGKSLKSRVHIVRDNISGVHNIVGATVSNIGCQRLLNKVRHSITMSLPEFDMSKIVE